MSEITFLWGAVAGYTAGTLAALGTPRIGRSAHYAVLGLLAASVVLLAAAIAERWSRLGHGPFLTLFEVLLSNVFSLGLIYAVVYWRSASARCGAVVALPVLVVLGAWALMSSPEPRMLPATYDNPWLWVHVLAGKLFLGSLLVAMGCAAALLLQRAAASERLAVDALTWRALAVAFVFQSLMLVAGAAWARDAWGRFWAWDPLETWSFVVWLAVGACLHQRLTYKLPAWVGWSSILVAFALAVVTFLGVPFFSVAAHKGVM